MRYSRLSLILGMILPICTSSFAAKVVDLRQHPGLMPLTGPGVPLFQLASLSSKGSAATQSIMEKTSEQSDSHGITHIRQRQMYGSYPVWAGDIVLHKKNHKTTMNGKIYQGLEADLQNLRSDILFNADHQAAAQKEVARLYQKNTGDNLVSSLETQKWVYVDKQNNKAHYAFLVGFATDKGHKPKFIVDASSLEVYEKWDNSEMVDPIPESTPGDQPTPAATDQTPPVSPVAEPTPAPIDQTPPVSPVAEPIPVPTTPPVSQPEAEPTPAPTDQTPPTSSGDETKSAPAPQPEPAPTDESKDNTKQDPAPDLTTQNVPKETTPEVVKLEEVQVSGLGGNENSQVGYDVNSNYTTHRPLLQMMRDPAKGICYVQNKFVTVKDINKGDEAISFPCAALDPAHGNTYWDGDFDKVNGAYSPANDALFLAEKTLAMYASWLQLPLMYDMKNKKMLMLNMRIHDHEKHKDNNASWDPDSLTMKFGDGDEKNFYPWVAPSVVSHELSHAFTLQMPHSQLVYSGQSGGLNESYSDIAAMAFEAYLAKTDVADKLSWVIGADVAKPGVSPRRYMKNPTHDCMFGPKIIFSGEAPKRLCSIDMATAYQDGMDPHLSSGVFNKAFYYLSKHWGVKKAFTIMAQANASYWTSKTDFQEAACGVKDSAYNYNEDPEVGDEDKKVVDEVMKIVGIDTTMCQSL